MQLRRPKEKSSSAEQSPQKRSATTKRLQPSESLHMKTRAASKNASVATSNDGSDFGNDSRRSSRAEISAKVGGSDSDSNRPTKRCRLSQDGQSEGQSFLSQPSESSAHEVIVVAGSGSQAANGTMTPEPTENNGSEASFEPNEEFLSNNDPEQDIAQASIEFPVMSDNRKAFGGKRKRRGKRMGPSKAANISASQTPMYGTPNQFDRVSSIKNESPGKRDNSKITKKLPGRRRAPHPDSQIEADLRRQLELKVAYRAVTKALKPILSELAKRTAKELEEDAEFHTRHAEYERIIGILDARLKERLSWLNHQKYHENARLGRILQAEKESANIRFQANVRNSQSDNLLRCQRKFLSIIRQSHREEDSEGTDDEDDIVPRLRRIAYPGGDRVVIDEAYDSRSRFFVEVQNYWKKFNHREDFRKEHREYDATSVVINPKGFATFDGEKRKDAIAVMNIHQLAKASLEVEDRALKATQKIISNQEASGLQRLAAASAMAVKVSLNSAGQAKTTRKQLPPISVSFAPVFTAPVSAQNQRPSVTVTPSPKKKGTSRGQSSHPQDATAGPPGSSVIQASPIASAAPNMNFPPPQGMPYNHATNDMGIYGGYREPYPQFRQPMGPDPSFTGPHGSDQQRPPVGSYHPPNRPIEMVNPPSRPEGPPPGSHFAFPLQPRGPPPPVLPPYLGPFAHPMPPPPPFRNAPFQASPPARSPTTLQSPMSPFAVGYPPRPAEPGSQQRQESAEDGHRRVHSGLQPYPDFSRGPSIMNPNENSNHNTAHTSERLPHQTLEAPVPSASRKSSSDDNSRDGHPLPPPPPQAYTNPFPPPPPPYAQHIHNAYYPPNNFYGASGPPRYGPIGASSPPTQVSSSTFFAGNFRPSLPQYQQSPAFPPISPLAMPGQHYPPPPAPPAPHARPITNRLQQHPGQIGHQTILPATLDPKRHQSNASPGTPPFPFFSQLSAIPRPPYGPPDSGPERPRGHQSNPVHFQFEPYKIPPKR